MILVQKNGDSFAILISRLWASSISCKTVGPTLCPNGLVSTRAGNSRSKGRSGADRRRDDRERALELTISATLEACRSVACETHGGIHRAGLQGGLVLTVMSRTSNVWESSSASLSNARGWSGVGSGHAIRPISCTVRRSVVAHHVHGISLHLPACLTQH
jgi:hypothetical protein